MQRYVLEPILFAIFDELLAPVEPVEYLMPYSTLAELYELRDSEQIVADAEQNVRVKQNLDQLIEFFEQPFVRKKIDRALRMPWQKSLPILLSENVTLTVVHALDNAVYGDHFDPIETELILLALREQVPIINDQIPFQKQVQEQRIPVLVLDISEFGFLVDDGEPEAEWREAEGTQAAAEQMSLSALAEEEDLEWLSLAAKPQEEQPLPKKDRMIPLLLITLFAVVIVAWFFVNR